MITTSDKKPVSKAQQKATAKYKKSNYDRMEVLLPKGDKDKIKVHADAQGKSLNGYVNEAIDEKMERDDATNKTVH